MCSSGGDRASPPREATRLHTLEPIPEANRRPQSSKPQSRHGERAPSRHAERAPSRATSRHGERPPSSRRGERPSSSKRPSTSASTSRKADRPSSSSRSRPSSSREQTSRYHDDMARRAKFEAIPEDAVQYPEDQAINRSAAELATLIDQHAESYYFHDDYNGNDPDLSDPRTRHAIIRQRIAKIIIREVVESAKNNSDDDLRRLAASLAREFREYAYGNNEEQRENHLCELCSIGLELRDHMSSHPATWEFGTWDEIKGRYIMVFPTLLKNDEQAAARRIIKI
ncbi:hypothetical protein B0J14DRAFT_204479 [Halenospora varia]|nr:hypothetical protein B0J14DRAFT_204479 [Halenospora varia]